MRCCLLFAVVLVNGCFSPGANTSSERNTDDSGSTGESTGDGRTMTVGGSTTETPTTTGTQDSSSTTTTASVAESSSGEASNPCEPDPCPIDARCVPDVRLGFVCDCTQGGTGAGCDVLPQCGNGVLENGEQCDEQEATPQCSESCESCDPPEPSSLIDQELAACVDGPQSDCRAGWAYFGNSSVQGVQVSSPGMLETISLHILNDAPDQALMHVYFLDGGSNPNFPSGASQQDLVNASLGSATAVGSTVPSWVDFDFEDEGIELDPTHHYFIWQRQLPPLPADPQDRFRWNLWASPEFPDPYAGGRSFFCPGGDTCSSQVQHWDFAFRLEMLPEVPLCE